MKLRQLTGRSLGRIELYGGRVLSRLRRVHLKLLYPTIHFSGRVHISRGVTIKSHATAKVQIKDCFIGRDVTIEAARGAEIILNADYIGARGVIVARDAIRIGEGSKIAEAVMIRDADHDHTSPLNEMRFCSDSVTIGSDCWIGYGAVILKGSTVGNGVTIGAYTVLNSSVPNGSTVVGVPGRITKSNYEGPDVV